MYVFQIQLANTVRHLSLLGCVLTLFRPHWPLRAVWLSEGSDLDIRVAGSPRVSPSVERGAHPCSPHLPESSEALR